MKNSLKNFLCFIVGVLMVMSAAFIFSGSSQFPAERTSQNFPTKAILSHDFPIGSSTPTIDGNENKEEDVKRIFISLPMRGRTELGIEQERRFIEMWCRNHWKDEDLIFVPPLSPLQAINNTPAYNLGLSIQHLGMSDVVVFSPDWKNANGCVIEHEVAERYNLPFVELGHTEDPGSAFKMLIERSVS